MLTDNSKAPVFFDLAGRLEDGIKMPVAQAECLAIWQSVMVIESLLLSAASAATAFGVILLLTPQALHMLPTVRSLYTTVIPLSIDLDMNWHGFLFLLSITTGAALVFTISPRLPSRGSGSIVFCETARTTARTQDAND